MVVSSSVRRVWVEGRYDFGPVAVIANSTFQGEGEEGQERLPATE